MTLHVPSIVTSVSPAMLELDGLIGRVALSDRPVLINGPTGAGKEVIAGQIHRLSLRNAAPLLAVNCGAMPDTLIEAHLFGHERGAFTGADMPREGYLAAVKDGSLFLDEIAELPLTLQPKLLRVLESRCFRPLGAIQEQRFQGRIIAATHCDLRARVAAKEFREDLFYRLNVFAVRVPALAERREDIPLLVRHFAAGQHRHLRFDEEAMATLGAVEWPGNVRQLRNVIDRIAVLSDDDPVTRATVLRFIEEQPRQERERLELIVGALLRLEMNNKLEAVTDALIRHALKEMVGNKSAAARLLGVHRKVVERHLAPQELEPA